MSTAVLRVKRALTLAQLDAPANLERITGAANEVWYAGDYVVRISSHPGTRRLEHEATVARAAASRGALPRHRQLRTRRVRRVARHAQDPRERSSLVRGRRCARASAATRCTSSPGRSARCTRSRSARTTRRSTGRRSSSPTASSARTSFRSLACSACSRRARTLPNVDKGVLDQAERLARINAASLNGPLARDARARRPAFRERALRQGRDHCAARLRVRPARGLPTSTSRSSSASARTLSCTCRSTTRRPSNRDDYRSVLRWIHEAYPELFENPSLESRLNLYSLSYDLRDLVVDPPRKPFDQLPPFHAYRRLASSSRRPRHAPAHRVVSNS